MEQSSREPVFFPRSQLPSHSPNFRSEAAPAIQPGCCANSSTTGKISATTAICPLECCFVPRSNRSRQTTVVCASLRSQMEIRSMPSPKASDSVTRGKNPSPSTDSAAKRERSSLIIFRCIRKTCRFFRCHKKKQPQPSSNPPAIYRKYNVEGTVLSAVPAAAVVGAASRARKIHDFVRQNRIFRLFIPFTISMLYAPTASGINTLSGPHVICLYLYSL